MHMTYAKFMKLGIDLAPLGVERDEDSEGYFCTPRGARIIGFLGVDGVHFCFVRGFGETVFVVSPMNPPDFVRPVARSFEDFLRLLLACGDAGVLEQAWMEQEKCDPTAEQRRTLDLIAHKTGLAPMEEPIRYIRELQSGFDCGKIKYTKDIHDPDMNPYAEPEWKVCYGSGFCGGSGRAGEEIRLDRSFDWEGRQWLILSVYLCGKGLVADICACADSTEVSAFIDKWSAVSEDGMTYEQELEALRENPLSNEIMPYVELNGKRVWAESMTCDCYYPDMPEQTSPQADYVRRRYGLSDDRGLQFIRCSFPWAGKRRPRQIRSLDITLVQENVTVPAGRFRATEAGEKFTFIRPSNGKEYTLTVEEVERQSIPSEFFDSCEWQCPTDLIAMRYTISPDAPQGLITVTDRGGDSPIRATENETFAPEGSCAIGIIGGSDGPTAAICSESSDRVAYSGLYFEPQYSVEWNIAFNEKEKPDITIKLI